MEIITTEDRDPRDEDAKATAVKAKQRYDTLKAQGKCPFCGKKPWPGHTKCLHCITRHRQYARRHRHRRQKMRRQGLLDTC